ncbi:ABC transporter permease [Sphingomonas profundi]|uniref:ABC transporter permease n=1 Tax=Alterirhizorhabdus profundi TaxID=2681549 RepID=UPI0018D05FEE|nr:ABC transporter permease [Sphingomonas profundi]
MATQPAPGPAVRGGFLRGLRVQANVVGALLMRELHTRYGRENIGYLWMIGEPLTFAGAIAILHSGHTTEYSGGMNALPFATLGYCVFIIFRGIFNRAEGALEANMPLLYHKMVTVFDIMLSRTLLEGCGTFVCLVIIMSLMTSLGFSQPPERPLYLLLGVFFMIWFSFSASLLIVAGTHDNRLLGRFVHPFTYIMMPISGAFYQMKWIPKPYQDWLWWWPMTQIFELVRYGYFRSGITTYFDLSYLTCSCLILMLLGMLSLRIVRNKVHLS